VVLYGCENWYLILRVFENRVQRTISGAKRGQIIGGRKKLHNEELHNLYTSSNTMTKVEVDMSGHVARMQKVMSCKLYALAALSQVKQPPVPVV
jgi:hypothetical protein